MKKGKARGKFSSTGINLEKVQNGTKNYLRTIRYVLVAHGTVWNRYWYQVQYLTFVPYYLELYRTGRSKSIVAEPEPGSRNYIANRSRSPNYELWIS
jgi:hypothetical protein